jgi:hypothetical protein
MVFWRNIPAEQGFSSEPILTTRPTFARRKDPDRNPYR